VLLLNRAALVQQKPLPARFGDGEQKRNFQEYSTFVFFWDAGFFFWKSLSGPAEMQGWILEIFISL